MDAFLQRLKRLDAYPKVNEDFYKRTLSGGIVTLVAAVVMLLLFISETSKSLSGGPAAGSGPICFFLGSFFYFAAFVGPAWLWNPRCKLVKKERKKEKAEF